MKRILCIIAVCMLLAPGCRSFGSNEGSDSSGGGGDSETSMMEIDRSHMHIA